MNPALLDRVLSGLPRQEDPRLLVGLGNRDDAGVYLLQDGLALVRTTDFLTPIVDNPYDYGQIAAANALSDVYAMGGRPLTALSVVCYPENGDLDIIERMLLGGMDKMLETGCTIAGGQRGADMVYITCHPDCSLDTYLFPAQSAGRVIPMEAYRRCREKHGAAGHAG